MGNVNTSIRYAFAASLVLSVCTVTHSASAQTSSPKFSYRNPLITAVNRGNLATTKKLVQNGIEANSRGQLDVTPLMRAAYHGYGDIAEYLLSAHADVNAVDIGGVTALHIASREGYIDITKLLLDSGANPDAPDDEEWTPLMRAARGRHIELVKLLLDSGASIDIANEFGETALMHAIHSKSSAIIASLIARGASTTHVNVLGVSALELARQKNIPEIEALIASASQANLVSKQRKSYAQLSPGQLGALLKPSGYPPARKSERYQPDTRYKQQAATKESPKNIAPTQKNTASITKNNKHETRRISPFIGENGEIDFKLVRSYTNSWIQKTEHDETAKAQKTLNDVRAAIAKEAAQRIEAARIKAEKEAAEKIENTKIKMAQFEADMRKYASASRAAIDKKAIISGVMDVDVAVVNNANEDAPTTYSIASAPSTPTYSEIAAQARLSTQQNIGNEQPELTNSAQIATRQTPPSPEPENAQLAADYDMNYVREGAGMKWLRHYDEYQKAVSGYPSSYTPPESYTKTVAAREVAMQEYAQRMKTREQNINFSREPDIPAEQNVATSATANTANQGYSEEQVQQMISQAVSKALQTQNNNVIQQAELKASQILAQAEQKVSSIMEILQSEEQRLSNLKPASGGRIEVARAIIEPAPSHLSERYNNDAYASKDTTENTASENKQTSNNEYWVEIGDFVTGRDAISHFAAVSRSNAIRGLRPHILYPEGDRAGVSIEIGPLTSYETAKQLCGFFRTDDVECALLDN